MKRLKIETCRICETFRFLTLAFLTSFSLSLSFIYPSFSRLFYPNLSAIRESRTVSWPPSFPRLPIHVYSKSPVGAWWNHWSYERKISLYRLAFVIRINSRRWADQQGVNFALSDALSEIWSPTSWVSFGTWVFKINLEQQLEVWLVAIGQVLQHIELPFSCILYGITSFPKCIEKCLSPLRFRESIKFCWSKF